MEPQFVELEYVLSLHDASLRAFGGQAGIRDRGLLESAATQPINEYLYAHADLFGIAAAYAFHLAQAQAFVDGNKRTAIATALAFLKLNGVVPRNNADRLYDAMIGIAEHRLTKADLAQLFRELFA